MKKRSLGCRKSILTIFLFITSVPNASLTGALPAKIISELISLLMTVKANVGFAPFVTPPPFLLSLDALTARMELTLA